MYTFLCVWRRLPSPEEVLCAVLSYSISKAAKKSEMQQTRTHYEVLRVGRDAGITALRAAYRARMLELHPDKRGGDAAGVCELDRVREAFKTLSDAAMRVEYDASLDTALPMLVTDEVCSDDFERDGDELVLACRCGGTFALAAGELAVVDIVPCDTCSLAVRIER